MLCIPTYIIRQKGKKHNFQIAKKIVNIMKQIVKCDIFDEGWKKFNIFSKKEINIRLQIDNVLKGKVTMCTLSYIKNEKGKNCMNWLNKLERKFGKYAVFPNLTSSDCMLCNLSFAISVFMPNMFSYLTLEPALILRGQVRRIKLGADSAIVSIPFLRSCRRFTIHLERHWSRHGELSGIMYIFGNYLYGNWCICAIWNLFNTCSGI